MGNPMQTYIVKIKLLGFLFWCVCPCLSMEGCRDQFNSEYELMCHKSFYISRDAVMI